MTPIVVDTVSQRLYFTLMISYYEPCSPRQLFYPRDQKHLESKRRDIQNPSSSDRDVLTPYITPQNLLDRCISKLRCWKGASKEELIHQDEIEKRRQSYKDQ